MSAFDLKKTPPIETALFSKEENGRFVLAVASDECGDVKMQLSPAVSSALFEAITNAMSLQLELDKLKPEERDAFSPELASNIVRGLGWFKAMSPEALVAQQLNGMFGAASAQKGN